MSSTSGCKSIAVLQSAGTANSSVTGDTTHGATDLPLGVTSSSPSLEERRLLPVHQSVGQIVSCSGKVMRSLAGIYGDVSEALYPVLFFD